MGDIVITEFISLDGVIEDPGGNEGHPHGGWTFKFERGDEGGAFKNDELMDADAQLLGRVTYQGFAEAWPERKEGFGDYGVKINEMPKYVVSTTLSDEDASWENSTVIRDDVIAGVRQLKEDVDGDILIQGSGALAKSLFAEGLIDRVRLMVFPVVLGSGKRLFPDDGGPMTSFELAESKAVGPDGVMVFVYQRHLLSRG